MLKLLVLAALVLAVIYFFNWVNRRPPGDWRRGDDDEDDGPGGPPSRHLGLEPDDRQDTDSDRPREPASVDDTGNIR